MVKWVCRALRGRIGRIILRRETRTGELNAGFQGVSHVWEHKPMAGGWPTAVLASLSFG